MAKELESTHFCILRWKALLRLVSMPYTFSGPFSNPRNIWYKQYRYSICKILFSIIQFPLKSMFILLFLTLRLKKTKCSVKINILSPRHTGHALTIVVRLTCQLVRNDKGGWGSKCWDGQHSPGSQMIKLSNSSKSCVNFSFECIQIK